MRLKHSHPVPSIQTGLHTSKSSTIVGSNHARRFIMAAWDTSFPPPRVPQTSRMPTPGIFVNVEFGVSLNTQRDRVHIGALRFGSKNVQSKIQRKRDEQFRQQRLQRQQQEELFFETTPTSLMPASGFYMQEQSLNQDQERPQRLTVRTQYERGSSAPPTLSDRHIPLSPIGSISPMSPVSPITTIQQIQHVSSAPFEGYERPLPSVPALFRLGEDGLPWSTEPFYRPQSPECVRASMVDIDGDHGRGEDPQRIRELESLQQAMMTVDTLPNDGWEPWTWDSVGDMPRGPRSIGWAVRSETTRSTPISPPPPPPYVASQWEESYDRYNRFRPRSSG
jgi:hypothetical protein